MILVVGATGQLGTAVVRRLTATGRPVRAFVRPGSASRAVPGPELALGDLRVPADVDQACRGVEAVICTANSVLPASGDRLGDVSTAAAATCSMPAAAMASGSSFSYRRP